MCNTIDLNVKLKKKSIIEITNPVGGEIYKVGDSVEVKWVVNDTNIVSWLIPILSTDNGMSFNQIALGFPCNTSLYVWLITEEQVSNKCIIGIADYSNSSYRGISGVFTISKTK